MKTFTLSNSFHGTEIRIRSNAETASGAWEEIQEAASREYRAGPAKAKLARIKRALCSHLDCCCGTVRK